MAVLETIIMFYGLIIIQRKRKFIIKNAGIKCRKKEIIKLLNPTEKESLPIVEIGIYKPELVHKGVCINGCETLDLIKFNGYWLCPKCYAIEMQTSHQDDYRGCV